MPKEPEKSITIEEYNDWVKNEGLQLTNKVCEACGRRTENCSFCVIHINQANEKNNKKS